MPKEIEGKFRFEKGIISSKLTKFGIPYDEILSYFTFKIDDRNLIVNDGFYFANFVVKREYSYSKSILQEVTIVVENKKSSTINKYSEKFEM